VLRALHRTLRDTTHYTMIFKRSEADKRSDLHERVRGIKNLCLNGAAWHMPHLYESRHVRTLNRHYLMKP